MYVVEIRGKLNHRRYVARVPVTTLDPTVVQYAVEQAKHKFAEALMAFMGDNGELSLEVYEHDLL